MTTIILQQLPCSPVYSAVGAQDYVLWKPTMFLHYFNDSDVDVDLTISSVEPDITGSYNSRAAMIPANYELRVGPFDVIYSPRISLACEPPTGVTVAALYTYRIPIAEIVLDGIIIKGVTLG